jgi:hypothetical protein
MNTDNCGIAGTANLQIVESSAEWLFAFPFNRPARNLVSRKRRVSRRMSGMKSAKALIPSGLSSNTPALLAV